MSATVTIVPQVLRPRSLFHSRSARTSADAPCKNSTLPCASATGTDLKTAKDIFRAIYSGEIGRRARESDRALGSGRSILGARFVAVTARGQRNYSIDLNLAGRASCASRNGRARRCPSVDGLAVATMGVTFCLPSESEL
jgi:hypothetical protein